MITQERLKQLFDYEPETGKLIHRRLKRVVGSNAPDYLLAKVDGKCYRVHRLIWLWVYGQLPIGEIDHINRERTDNRLSNLRDVSRAQNMQNKNQYRNNTSGVTGVSFNCHCNKWAAFYRDLPAKYFDSKKEAIEARQQMELSDG